MGVFTTAATTWAVGNKITAAGLNGQLRDFINGFGAFTSYTPTLAGFTPGNGVATGAYLQVQKLVIFRASFTFGTTSAAAAALPTLTLPVTSTALFGQATMPGSAVFRDDSAAAIYTAFVRHATTTTVALAVVGTNGLNSAPSTTSPFTWAVNDVITVHGVYEAA
jgi:hypothetical protein